MWTLVKWTFGCGSSWFHGIWEETNYNYPRNRLNLEDRTSPNNVLQKKEEGGSNPTSLPLDLPIHIPSDNSQTVLTHSVKRVGSYQTVYVNSSMKSSDKLWRANWFAFGQLGLTMLYSIWIMFQLNTAVNKSK